MSISKTARNHCGKRNDVFCGLDIDSPAIFLAIPGAGSGKKARLSLRREARLSF
jgi:hypothetical protein